MAISEIVRAIHFTTVLETYKLFTVGGEILKEGSTTVKVMKISGASRSILKNDDTDNVFMFDNDNALIDKYSNSNDYSTTVSFNEGETEKVIFLRNGNNNLSDDIIDSIKISMIKDGNDGLTFRPSVDENGDIKFTASTNTNDYTSSVLATKSLVEGKFSQSLSPTNNKEVKSNLLQESGNDVKTLLYIPCNKNTYGINGELTAFYDIEYGDEHSNVKSFNDQISIDEGIGGDCVTIIGGNIRNIKIDKKIDLSSGEIFCTSFWYKRVENIDATERPLFGIYGIGQNSGDVIAIIVTSKIKDLNLSLKFYLYEDDFPTPTDIRLFDDIVSIELEGSIETNFNNLMIEIISVVDEKITFKSYLNGNPVTGSNKGGIFDLSLNSGKTLTKINFVTLGCYNNKYTEFGEKYVDGFIEDYITEEVDFKYDEFRLFDKIIDKNNIDIIYNSNGLIDNMLISYLSNKIDKLYRDDNNINENNLGNGQMLFKNDKLYIMTSDGLKQITII